MRAGRPMWRMVWMPFVLAVLLAGLWGGLVRAGWGLPAFPATLAGMHGPLMISGFLGIVVTLERAVAMNWKWAYAAPALALAGAFDLLAGGPEVVGKAGMTLASAVFLLVIAKMTKRFRAKHLWVMLAAVACWTAGNALWWIGKPVPLVAGWWAAFLVLFIAAERLELSRVISPPARSRMYFAAAAALILLGALLGAWRLDAGARMLGFGFVAMAGWLFAYDVTRPAAGVPAATRFMGIGLRLGYSWLAAGGFLLMTAGNPGAGLRYDAVLHCVFVGFVFSLIFAHSIIILPALSGMAQSLFTPATYVPLALLHGSLIVRIAGDLMGDATMRRAGGAWNAAAILLHFVILGVTTRRTLAKEGR